MLIAWENNKSGVLIVSNVSFTNKASKQESLGIFTHGHDENTTIGRVLEPNGCAGKAHHNICFIYLQIRTLFNL